MKIPVQVAFHGLPVSDVIEAACLREAEKLERFYDRITRCRVTIEQESSRHTKGDHWNIHVYLTVPGGEIVANRDPELHVPNEKIELALREVFDRARRQLQDFARRQDARVKHHEGPEEGRVVRISALEGFGFIESADGLELYFHRNALVDGAFEDLDVGSEVRFVAEPGDRGPQATSIRVSRRHAS